jgi:hypothetical protein
LKKILLLAFGMLLPALAPLSAQARRFSFAPTIGYIWPTSIFEHNVVFPSDGGFPPTTEHRRLRVHPALVIGGRFGYALTPSWKLYAEGTSSGTTQMEYFDRLAVGPDVGAYTAAGREASFHTLELGAERVFHLATRLPTIGVKMGAGSYYFAIMGEPLLCQFPNIPPETACPWTNHYNIMSAIAGLVVRQSIGSHVALELEGKRSTGNANTSSFFVDLFPQFDQFEAPKTHRVNTTQLSLGVSVF